MGSGTHDMLLTAELEGRELSECKVMYPAGESLTEESHFCAVSERSDACRGDSGGK